MLGSATAHELGPRHLLRAQHRGHSIEGTAWGARGVMAWSQKQVRILILLAARGYMWDSNGASAPRRGLFTTAEIVIEDDCCPGRTERLADTWRAVVARVSPAARRPGWASGRGGISWLLGV